MSDLIKCKICKIELTLDKFKLKRDETYTKRCIDCLEKAKIYSQNNKCPHGRQCRTRCKDCMGKPIRQGKCSRCRKDFDNSNETELYNGKPLQTCEDCRYKCIHGKRGLKDCEECRTISINNKNEKRRNNKCEHGKRKDSCMNCSTESALMDKVRRRINQAIKRDKKMHSLEYICCDVNTLKKHIEDNFKDGMSWDNYGDWHIDHIIPLKYKEDGIEPSLEIIIERMHYKNLQPLWADENISKGNRYIG